MHHSLEVRVPILDHEFAELSFKIPTKFKMHGKSKKHILKEAFRSILPDEIISHRKQGFNVPLNQTRERILPTQKLHYHVMPDFLCL